MTCAPRLAEQLLGPHRAVRLLDGSPEQAAQFAAWYVPAWHGAHTDALMDEGLAAFHLVLDDDAVGAWWACAAGGKPALPRRTLVRGCGGVMRVEILEDGDWRPAEAPERGAPAVVWCCQGHASPARALDLIAMHPSMPSQWRRRTGLAAVLPHDDAVYDLEDGDTLRLFDAPIAWLAAGCPPGGLCVLDWSAAAAQDLLRLVGDGAVTAVCDDAAHAARLAARARPKRPPLRLRVAAGGAAE